MANTVLLIGAHGAGLVNAIFLPSLASILEVVPYRYPLSLRDLTGTLPVRQHLTSQIKDPALFLGKRACFRYRLLTEGQCMASQSCRRCARKHVALQLDLRVDSPTRLLPQLQELLSAVVEQLA